MANVVDYKILERKFVEEEDGTVSMLEKVERANGAIGYLKFTGVVFSGFKISGDAISSDRLVLSPTKGDYDASVGTPG